MNTESQFREHVSSIIVSKGELTAMDKCEMAMPIKKTHRRVCGFKYNPTVLLDVQHYASRYVT
jgi:hypothetical protein